MNRRNQPLAAQKPAPGRANDFGGFFGTVSAENQTLGIRSLLPAGTVYQSDTAILARILASQIEWKPTKARYKGAELTVSISDAQFFLALESGGDVQEGRIAVTVSKFQFNTAFPAFGEVFEIFAAGCWHTFIISEMIGQNDDNEPALALYLEKDQNDIGN